MSIISSFNKGSSNTDLESFTITHFKRLLLDFIVNNNISFYIVTISSFESFLIT